MPGQYVTELGKITISEDIIASIAGYAAMENYGIVGMSAKTTSDSFMQLFGSENHKKGVKVTLSEDGTEVEADLYVTLIYGVSLPAVAQNTIQNVRYRLHELTGLNVKCVTIHVEAIRV